MSAYRVRLEQFSGPLDLMWHLIRTEELDILDLDVARITDAYLRFIEEHGVRNLADAYNFLAMAAGLVELKSRTLLPRPPPEEGEGDEAEPQLDPRDELVQRLRAFRSIQDITGELEERFEQTARHWPRQVVERFEQAVVYTLDSLSAYDLMSTFHEVLTRPRFRQVAIFREPYSLEAAREAVSSRLQAGPVPLAALLEEQEDVLELIVTFLAVLELIKDELVGFERREGGVMLVEAQPSSPV